jgi:TolB-like protein
MEKRAGDRSRPKIVFELREFADLKRTFADPNTASVANLGSIRDHAGRVAGALDMAEGGGEQKAGVGTPAIFISYASQDAEAAQRICEALRAGGIEVWFDQSELRGGDAWDQSIRKQIKTCALFLPIISRGTHDRDEGYFRLEWKLAVDRSHLMTGNKAFLLPVVIDDTRDDDENVPDRFREVQWTRLPAGETPPAFVQRVQRLMLPQSSSTGRPATDAMPSSRALGEPLGASRQSKAALLGIVAVFAGTSAYLLVERPWIWKHVAGKPMTATASASAAPANAAPFAPPPHSIAVLPFMNMSGDPKQEYFSDGISEELLNALSRLNDLEVVARTSSFSFKGQNVDVSTIAHKLNVGAVLEGSVRRAGSTVRITVQLINAVDGFHMWSQTYDRQLSDVLKVQSDVANSVARELEVKLVGDESTNLEAGGTKNAQAYDSYLRGIQAYDKAYSEADYRLGLAAADEAIQLDPGYAAAYVLRATSLLRILLATDDRHTRPHLLGQMLAAAQNAVRLAPELGDAHLVLANTYALGLLDFGAADPEYERALALAPGSVLVQRSVAGFFAAVGRYAPAVTAARRAVALDPRSVRSQDTLGIILYLARRYAEAVSAFQAAKALNPDAGDASVWVLLASGHPEQARQECESYLMRHHEEAKEGGYCFALADHALGRQADAEREFGQFKSSNGDEKAYAYAQLYAQFGDKAAALEWLEKAYRLRDPSLQDITGDWLLDPIRNEPQFKTIRARMNLPP